MWPTLSILAWNGGIFKKVKSKKERNKMASITIMQGVKNLVFASEVANQTGATFEESGQQIIISDSPRLVIPRYCFNSAFDPEGQRVHDGRLERAWLSLILKKNGYLEYRGDDEIVITDDPPAKKRPATLLRWSAQREKDEAEAFAERLGMSLNEYIVNAVAEWNRYYREQSADEDEGGQQ